jgi:hypothetical protein
MINTIQGHAFTPDEKATSERRQKRFEELKPWREKIIREVNPQYGKTVYRGRIPEGCPILTDEDIAIVCDSGNCCFGGSVTRDRDWFICTIWID